MDPLSQGDQKTNAIKQREGTAETHIDVPHTITGTTKHIQDPQTQTNNPSNVKCFDGIDKNGTDEWKMCSELLKHFTDKHVAMAVPLVCNNISILFFVFGLILGDSFPPLFLYLPPFFLFQ